MGACQPIGNYIHPQFSRKIVSAWYRFEIAENVNVCIWDESRLKGQDSSVGKNMELQSFSWVKTLRKSLAPGNQLILKMEVPTTEMGSRSLHMSKIRSRSREELIPVGNCLRFRITDF